MEHTGFVVFGLAPLRGFADALLLRQYDQRFATFVLTQLFASSEDLERTGREEIGMED